MTPKENKTLRTQPNQKVAVIKRITASFLIILIFASITGCTKKVLSPPPPPDRFPDTLYPTDYLPAWPGSWWKYTNEKGDTSKVTTSSTFVKDEMNFGDHKESAFVPFYDGFPLWSNWLRLDVRGSHQFVRVVTDSVPIGTKWYGGGYYESGGTVSHLTLVAKDTTILISGKSYSSVVVLKHSYGRASQIENEQDHYYYAKNIGLIRMEQRLNGPDSIGTFKNLHSYFINHK